MQAPHTAGIASVTTCELFSLHFFLAIHNDL